ncbi:MAG TPA: PHP domain-containing protein [Clostridia bacterium]
MEKFLSDLHLHSFNSDGEADYLDQIKRAKDLGLDAIALTDHDTLNGVKDFLHECKKNNLKAISGIELSCFDQTEIHILGYNVDPSKPSPLVKELANLSQARKNRMIMIIDKLKSLGVHISYDEIIQKYKTNSVSRYHIAKLMVEKGYVKSKEEAYYLYLFPGKPAFVDFFYFDPFKAVEIIAKSGGTAVLAHPGRMRMDSLNLENLVKKLAEAGLKGIETYYPAHSKNAIKFFKQLAKKYNLINTNGSDTHNIYDNSITNFETEPKTIEVLGLR